MEVPRPDGMLDGGRQCVLADAMFIAAKHERVIDLVLRALHPMRQKSDDVLAISTWIEFEDVLQPWPRLAALTGDEGRGSVEVEAAIALALNPTTVCDQAVIDEHGQSGRPRLLLNGPVAVEP